MLKNIFINSCLLLSIVATVAAQTNEISYTEISKLYTQNFNGLPPNGFKIDVAEASAAPRGPFNLAHTALKTIGVEGWQIFTQSGNVAPTIFASGNGSSTGGGFYSFGAIGSKERALGIGCASTNSNASIGVIFINNTGKTITEFTISYTGEQWRTAGNAAINSLKCKYAIGTSDVIQNISNGMFVEIPALNFSSPIVNGNTAEALDGNALENKQQKTFTVNNIKWEKNQKLIIRWDDVRQGSSNQNHCAIDDFSFSAASK